MTAKTGSQPHRIAKIPLPPPRSEGETSVESALRGRRSVRHFAAAALSLDTVGQLLWAAQGLSSSAGDRTAPSAGGLYPLETYLVAGNVAEVAAGVYKYRPRAHELRLHAAIDLRRQLADAALGQDSVAMGAVVLVIAADYARTAVKYRARAERFVHMEVGHAAQNVYLQACSLGLGTVLVGAFEDDRIRDLLELPAGEAPLALMPVGRPR